MSALASLSDLTDLDAVREALAMSDPECRLVPLGLRRLVIARGAVEGVADAVSEELVRAGTAADGSARVVVLVDATAIVRSGADLKNLVEQRLAARFTVERVVLRDTHPSLHADEQALETATEAVRGADCVVSVGSGTITDIGKLATSRAAGQPLVVVQTAASVDGYTDNVSVVLRSGVKRTIPSRWPDVVLADVETIVQAPATMNAAGYGEVLSMFTAPADWYLASILGMDDSFHPAPKDLLEVLGRGIEQWSPGVGRGEPAAVEQLTRVLGIRGVATGVAGTTACLSGVEHVISHMLDMHHGERGLPVGLHGAQVGVTSLVAAAAWELLHARLDAEQVEIDALFPEPAALAPMVLAAFDDLDPSGRIGAECWRAYREKIERWNGSRGLVAAAFADWDRHRSVLGDLVLDPGALGAGLVAAGATARFSELEPAISPKLARWAVAHCHLMRDRFTVVDLLSLLGWWTDDEVEAVLAVAERAVGPAGSVAA